MAKKARIINANGTAFLNNKATPEIRNKTPQNKSIAFKPYRSAEKSKKLEKCTNSFAPKSIKVNPNKNRIRSVYCDPIINNQLIELQSLS